MPFMSTRCMRHRCSLSGWCSWFFCNRNRLRSRISGNWSWHRYNLLEFQISEINESNVALIGYPIKNSKTNEFLWFNTFMNSPLISILGCGWLGLPLANTLNAKKSTDYAIRVHETHITGNLDFFTCDTLIITLPFKRTFQDPHTYTRQIQQILHHAPTPWIILTSSTSIYTPGPRSQALQDTETLLTTRGNTTILRLAGLYCPNREPGKFLAGKTNIPNTPINLIHQDDVIAIIQQLIQKNLRNQTFDLASDHHPLKKDYYTQKAKELGLPTPTFIEPDHPGKIIDNTPIKTALNYTFIHQL